MHLTTSLSIHFGDFVLLMRIAESWKSPFSSADSLMKVRRHLGQASRKHTAFTRHSAADARPERLLRRVSRSTCQRGRSSVAKLQRRIALLHRVGMAWGVGDRFRLERSHGMHEPAGRERDRQRSENGHAHHRQDTTSNGAAKPRMAKHRAQGWYDTRRVITCV